MGEQIAALDERTRTLDESLKTCLLSIPNLPHASAPVGNDDSANPVIKEHGTPRTFNFKSAITWKSANTSGLIDFKRAARMSGAGFPLYTGAGARLQRALIKFMLDVHAREHGYREVWPPFVVNPAAMTGTGQLPKMAEDMYAPADDLYLIPHRGSSRHQHLSRGDHRGTCRSSSPPIPPVSDARRARPARTRAG